MGIEMQFGANIIDSLTVGLYKDPRVIYREYIQNSCDAIDKAVKNGILASANDGKIDITIEKDERRIHIKDNGTGIPADSFVSVMANVADSKKTIGEDKGFRGVGRLSGLSYCTKLVFKSKAKGENIISTLTCDARKMRDMLLLHQSKQENYSANDIFGAIYNFETEETANLDEHYFVVSLMGVEFLNNDLLDIDGIRENLSFVAPVPYVDSFVFASKIYEHAKSIGATIDEYNILVNNKKIFKNYTDVLYDKNGEYDRLLDVDFCTFKDKKNTIAWMWVGLCSLTQVIPLQNKMRGIRVRKENIQIGDQDALQKLFKEDRGNSYFVGECFAIDKALIPNAQRDYFNLNGMREEFEKQFKDYAIALKKGYETGILLAKAREKKDKYQEVKAAFEEQQASGAFENNEERKNREEKKVREAKEDFVKESRNEDKKLNNIIKDQEDEQNKIAIKLVALARQKEREEDARRIIATQQTNVQDAGNPASSSNAGGQTNDTIQDGDGQGMGAQNKDIPATHTTTVTTPPQVQAPKPATTPKSPAKPVSADKKELIMQICDIIFDEVDGKTAKQLEKKIKEKMGFHM